MKEFNLNYSIYVRLTNKGYERLAELHNAYVGVIPTWEKRIPHEFKLKADKEGYTKFQAWTFIEKFGPVSGLCSGDKYFDINILIDESDLKEPTK